jgi:hypothetical protein
MSSTFYSNILILVVGLVTFFLLCPLHSHGFLFVEHESIGQSVDLWNVAGQRIPAAAMNITLPNGAVASFGHLVAISADLLGDPKYPISDASDPQDAVRRFEANFNVLATKKESAALIPRFIELNAGVKATIIKELEQGRDPSVALLKLKNFLNGHYNIITGGGHTLKEPWLPFGLYLNLANVDWDHFRHENRSVRAYSTGHAVAISLAADAGRLFKAKRTADAQAALDKALAAEAFACHFLTDSFAAGHERTPRKEFNERAETATLGAALSSFQHDEENRLGLLVTTRANATVWTSYGDHYYFDRRSDDLRRHVIAATQMSVDELFAAYTTQTIAKSYQALDNLPIPLVKENYCPLFLWNADGFWKRKHVSNPWSTDYKKHKTHFFGGGWTVPTTLLEMSTVYHPPTNLPPRPAGFTCTPVFHS